MVGSASDYAENKLLELLVGKTAFTLPTVHIALLTAAPTDATVGSGLTEPLTASNYARIATSGKWGTAASGIIINSGEMVSNVASADWGTITHYALVDSATRAAGNVLIWASVTTPKEVLSGDSITFAAGSISISAD